MSTIKQLSPDLLAAAEALARDLSQSEPISRYHRALEQLETDGEAPMLLDRLGELQAALRVRQTEGAVTQADLDRLRAAQAAAQANPAIQAYADSQQASQAYLRAVNAELSQLLGVDFAALARQPGRC